jgi:predicted kinase
MTKPILVATLGYPGSGKTYFAENLARECDYFHFNADKTRLNLFLNPTYTNPEHITLFRLMDHLTEELLKSNTSVIYDANFNKIKTRVKLQEIADRAGADYRLVWIQTDIDLAIRRIKTRFTEAPEHQKQIYRPIDESVLHSLKQELQEPLNEECGVIRIDGHLTFEEQFEIFKASL